MGGRGYGDNLDSIISSCERYDPITNLWSFIGSLNVPRSTFHAHVYNNKLVVLGGIDQFKNRVLKCEAYDVE
jgi:hypothetical protein